MRAISCAVLSWALLASAVGAADVPAISFTKKPTATRVPEGIKIEFAVAAATDVAVFIRDASGKTLRHLAAGVLGPNPPAPLKPDSLDQSLLWDGKTDGGEAVPETAPKPLKVRVALGLKAEFDSFLMENPDGSGEISAVAVGPGGTLYAFHRDDTVNGNMGGNKLKVYTREGRHLKVLIPFPADIAPEKVRALGVFQTQEGDLVPRVHNWETLSFYPDLNGVRGRDMPEFSAPAVDSRGRVYWLVKGPALAAVAADGGIPYDTFLGPRLLPDIKDLKLSGPMYMYCMERTCLAVSSDEKSVYFTGLSGPKNPLPCVFRVSVDTRGPGDVFVGQLDRPGQAGPLLTAPRGLAVAKGLLYVADFQADRIVVFRESDRSYVGQIPVKAPDTLGVDPSTGAVYVCAFTGKQTADLIKFSGLEDGKEICRMALPRTGLSPNPGIHRIAVDASQRPVRIWVPSISYNPCRLKCIEDADGQLVDKGDPRRRDPWIPGPRDLSIDRLRDELYVRSSGGQFFRFDEKTGKLADRVDVASKIRSTVPSTQLVPGSDGNLYTYSWGAGLWRFDRNAKPLNWEGQKSHIIPIEAVMCFQIRHLALRPFAPPDELYIVAPPTYRLTYEDKMKPEAAAKLAPGRFTSLNVIGQDGKTRRTVVWQCLDGAIPRLDAAGNVYLADLVKPRDRSYPEFFDGKLEAPPKECGGGDRFWYSYMYGSIIKFPPTGGAIWFRKGLVPKCCVGQPPAELLAKPCVPFKTHLGYSPHMTGELQGALWSRFGYSPYSCGTTGMTDHCMCEGSGFDVDPFGRVFFPNLGQFRVEVIDTNNNPIATFGKYGNEDSGGPNSPVKKPDIPLAWPVHVAVSDTHAYVADTVNRRVVRVKLGAAAEATSPLP